jgi:hypothetical protein
MRILVANQRKISISDPFAQFSVDILSNGWTPCQCTRTLRLGKRF